MKYTHPEPMYYRRGFRFAPRFDGEEHLRLLSMQHNAITRIDALAACSPPLHRLLYLDLYDNEVRL